MENNDALDQTNNKELQFAHRFENLKKALENVQITLEHFVQANDNLIADKGLGVKFFSRVNMGKATESFSDLARGLLEHENNLKNILKPKAPATASPEGETSGS